MSNVPFDIFQLFFRLCFDLRYLSKVVQMHHLKCIIYFLWAINNKNMMPQITLCTRTIIKYYQYLVINKCYYNTGTNIWIPIWKTWFNPQIMGTYIPMTPISISNYQCSVIVRTTFYGIMCENQLLDRTMTSEGKFGSY